ncbi:hypothetical protein AB0F71_10175 [Kitasatospora sp. NPDC028055]|uniref:hypothetical protein n=1 Tax=Kitasatospora sp. NPDC028055 TaxID=3155653 RepID=UPI0033F712D4
MNSTPTRASWPSRWTAPPPAPSTPPPPAPDPSLVYSGSWSYLTGRGYGDFNDDVHSTTTDGDSVTATFNGTGADVVTETNSDEGTMDVYVDGQPRGSVNANTPTRNAQQRVYTIDGLPYGVHTLKLVKISGSYLLVDRLTYR